MATERFAVLSPFVLLFILLAAPSRAEAKGLLLITHGDTASQLAPIPPESAALVKAATKADPKFGYCYSYFGLFWLDLWTWGGKLCLYDDHSVWNVSDDEVLAIMKAPAATFGKPILYRFPPLLVVLCLLGGLIGWGVLAGAREQKAADALLKDPRYPPAVTILKEAVAAGRSDGEALAAQHLVEQGVAPDLATKHATLLKSVFAPDPDHDTADEDKPPQAPPPAPSA